MVSYESWKRIMEQLCAKALGKAPLLGQKHV